MGWEHHGFPFPFFGLIFLSLVTVLIIFKMIAFRRCHSYMNNQNDASVILKRRLASGDIKEEEYKKLKQLVDK
ncbi:hypothetical protein [Fictibacillus sp. KU28468]|uniref:hypothetical protein n=1 Tax=Fictibacillus sp. KU28468 TaxID=2991053 RepID=UPI00223D6E6C|nr:hypothetical protein [Fictibacillus sp. KU28468]UZJ76832.1 hypothetical protein OKX00_11435 [Fictibacillus sp. KU28468]